MNLRDHNASNNTSSPTFRWIVSILCIVLIVLAFVITCNEQMYGWKGSALKKACVLVVATLIGLSGLGTIWGKRLSSRVLAAIFGILSLLFLAEKWLISNKPIFAMSKSGFASDPLNALLSFLLLGFPLLLYAGNFRRVLKKYIIPWTIIFALYVIFMLTHGVARIIGLSGLKYFLIYIPHALLVSWVLLRSIVAEHQDRKRGWRIGYGNYGCLTYEERIDGKWVRIELRCQGDYRECPMDLILPTHDEWQLFPSWTEARHAVILERIRDSIKEADYTIVEHQ